MFARIYRPAKTAMQSGRAKSARWVLAFDAETAKRIDPLMGWTTTTDMNQQVELAFDTRQEAIDFAKRRNIPHQVIEPKERRVKPKSYAQNFAHDRRRPWTH